ncbi:MAG: hypothetical protein KBC43_12475, partial [Bacteroidales bacterium]|nr:hypothetical protein [Bacteroidales bacterium]
MRLFIRCLIFIILISYPEDSFCQSDYLNKRYNLCQDYGEDAWSGADGIIQLEDGYVIAGFTVDTGIYWWRRIPILKIDTEGNPILYKSYGDTVSDYYTGWSGIIKMSNNSNEFYIAGSINYWIPDNYDVGLLMKFDLSLDTLWTKEYNMNLDSIPDTSMLFNQMDICLNNDLIFGGYMNGSYMLLMRTDSAGNELWHKLFHYGSYTLCTGYSVIQTTDGGFALGGFMYTIGQPETGNPVIIKTDSAGNQEWVQFMGGPLLDDAAFLARSGDGNIIMGSTYGDIMAGNESINRINIAKLNNDGEVLWDKKYGLSKHYNYLLNIKVLNNGEILAWGQCPVDFPHYSAWILKVDQNGDSLWYREYDYLTGPESRNILWEVIETSNNGLIACGDVFPMLPDTGNRDAWVIKLDSIGCEFEGCDTTVGIKDDDKTGRLYDVDKSNLDIWPNPASGIVDCRLPIVDLRGDWTLMIYDIFGREVLAPYTPSPAMGEGRGGGWQ